MVSVTEVLLAYKSVKGRKLTNPRRQLPYRQFKKWVMMLAEVLDDEEKAIIIRRV